MRDDVSHGNISVVLGHVPENPVSDDGAEVVDDDAVHDCQPLVGTAHHFGRGSASKPVAGNTLNLRVAVAAVHEHRGAVAVTDGAGYHSAKPVVPIPLRAADVKDAVVLAEQSFGLLAPCLVLALELGDEARGRVGRHLRDGIADLREVGAEVASNPHQRDARLLAHERGPVSVEALRDAGGALVVARGRCIKEVAATPALASSSAVADLVGSFGHIKRRCGTPRRG